MAALEAGDLQGDQIGMARRELCRPDLVVRARGICVLPDIADVERVLDAARADLFAEESVEQVLIERQEALREDRIAELLELVHDLVVDAGIMVIDAPKHDDADAALALQFVERLARALANR